MNAKHVLENWTPQHVWISQGPGFVKVYLFLLDIINGQPSGHYLDLVQLDKPF